MYGFIFTITSGFQCIHYSEIKKINFSTRRRGFNGANILRDHLRRIKGCSDFEKVICSLKIYNSKYMDGMKVVSNYITNSETKVIVPLKNAKLEEINGGWNKSRQQFH